ncbi:MAG: phosphoglucosamine mutase [Chloroflexota bacterium]
MPLIRSISGLRATLPDSLTEDIVRRYCYGFHSILPGGEIVIGRDGRPSGEHIERLAADCLYKLGRKVRILGIVPTPTVQLEVEKSSAVGGIAITASHNPSQWNGLKFISSEGVFLNKQANEELWRYADTMPQNISPMQGGGALRDPNAIERHIDSILRLKMFSCCNLEHDLALRKVRVVVDAVNASGSVAAPMLLERLGCEVIRLHCDGSGNFPHTPEPLPENLTSLASKVAEIGADLGVAVDPDADRLVLIDERGTPVWEELTIALAIESALAYPDFSQGEKCAVVNLSTSGASQEVCERRGAKLYRSPVGEINVVEEMKLRGALIGGEGSGGVILPACHYGRDSLVGIALVLALIARSGKSLSQLVDEMPKRAMIKTKFPSNGAPTEAFERIIKKFPGAAADLRDGLRLDMDGEWAQIRASNTEPIVRVIAESAAHARSLELIGMIKEEL